MASRSERYRLGKLLGRGGVAEVYEAIGVDAAGVEQRLALKRLIDVDEGQLEAFADEAKIASRLRHPNLVQVLDYGVLDDRPFLALELVEGLDLDALLDRAKEKGQRLTVELAIFIAIEVAHGLSAAHEARGLDGRPLGIVHRDVSPSNVLVSAAGEVKLSDFGIALANDRLARTAVGTVKGKKSYMPPEQALGEPVDARADLFALGCLLCFLVSGKSPLEDLAAQETMLRGGAISLPPNLLPPLAAVLQTALARSPSQRYETAAQMAAALGKILYARLDRDPRTMLKSFVAKLMEGLPTPRRSELEDLMDVARILGAESEALPRFSSVLEPPRGGTLEIRDKITVTQRIRERQKLVDHGSDGTGSDGGRTPSADEDRLVGTVLHGYRLTSVIGRGALARVYRAEHLVLARQYAVKILYGRAAENERSQRRLEREAVTLSQLVHPNIVTVVDFGMTDDEQPFLTMELLEGRTLSEAIKMDGPFRGERAAHVAKQIAAALAKAHECDVVHRDLKPGNVMLVPQPDGRELVKVLDFGIARISDPTATRLTSADILLGTPRYMAPEQITGATTVGPPADLYALGAVLYTMLSGRPPFVGKTLEVVEKQLHDAPPPLTSMTGLESLTIELLAKKPQDRPASAKRVVQLIDAMEFADPGPTLAVTSMSATRAMVPRESTPQPPSNERSMLGPPRSNAQVAPLAFAALGLLIAGTVLGIALSRGPQPTEVAVSTPPPPPIDLSPSVTTKPRVEALPEEAPPPIVTPPPPVKDKEHRATPPPPPRREVSLAERETGLKKELAQRGLSAADLEALPAAASARSRFLSAVKANDEASAKEAESQFLAALRNFEPDRQLLDAKVSRIKRKLAKAREKVAAEEYDKLENRYLDALDASKSGSIASELLKLYVLEVEVERAGS